MKSSHFSSTQRIGDSELRNETFVSGRSLLELSMKSIHFGSNVENRPFGAPKRRLLAQRAESATWSSESEIFEPALEIAVY